MASIPSIPGTEEVMAALGWWPSFHDAEVIQFSLSRGETPDQMQSDASLAVQVREYEAKNEGTAQYELALIKNVIIRFAFAGVQDVQVEDFNFQNVINSLTVREELNGTDVSLRVQVESTYGFSATWLCRSARVEGVTRAGTSAT